MGEQDDRYTYSYSLQGVLAAGSGSYFDQYKRFRDWSDQLEFDSGGTMSSLQHSPWSSHYYFKTGLYATGGSETASSAHSAQTVYSFLRGAAKQYGLAVYGQVSVFSLRSGFKTYGAGGASNCSSSVFQDKHGPPCGTSLSLMKRLLYTEMSYDAVYFAFEGGCGSTDQNPAPI
jgi:hypothetical protein